MLGTILWNSGALGAWSPANVITFTATAASKSSDFGVGRSIGATTMHSVPAIAGNQLLGFLGDFYFRFHITTVQLDLGNLVSDQTQPITIWNAYRRAWTLNSLTLTNAEGITVTGQPAPPLQFAPLQELTYTLGISTDGPATLNATIAWNFSNGSAVVLGITGSRIVPWNWQPDWSEAIIERLEWRTDVLSAFQGQEQRRALRINPRQQLEFSVTASGESRRLMESIMWGWGSRTWAVPLWFDGQELAAPLASGVTSIPINPAQRGYEVGGLVMLTNGDPRTFEVVEIATLTSTIGLARPTTQTWGTGTRVYPARPARILNSAQLDRFTGMDASLRLQWEMIDPMTWAAAASPLYRGLPVLEHKPNWIESPTLEHERKLSVFDSQLSPVVVNDQAGIPLTNQVARYTLTSRAMLDTWKQRLWALRGKHAGVWVPTWSQDIAVAGLIADTATNIDVNWLGYTKYMAGDPGRRDIRIETTTGAVFYRRITGSTELSTTTERLSIDSSLGVTLQVSQIAMVSFMAQARASSDSHELAYFSGDVADTVFSSRSYRGAA